MAAKRKATSQDKRLRSSSHSSKSPKKSLAHKEMTMDSAETSSGPARFASSNKPLSEKASHADGKAAKEGFLRVKKMIEDVTAIREKAELDSCLGQAELRFYDYASKLTGETKKKGVIVAGKDLASMVQGYHPVERVDLPDIILEHEYLAFQDDAY